MRTIALALAALASGAATPWKHYVVSGAAAARGIPATVTPAAPATIVWSHEVAGNLQLTFAAVAPNTLVRVAFSETAEYLGIGGTSDWSRTYTTDAHLARSGETWTDTSGCEAAGVCADGYRAFRFARVYVDRGSARIVGATVRTASPGVATPRGWFLSSDDEVNRIWYAGAYTAQLAELPNDPAVLGSGCTVPADARVVLVDGAKRDRCPWVGDQVVTDPTLFLANGAQAAQPVADTLSVFANAQLPDGYIPASPAATSVLFDYPAYFVLAVDEYLLYRGDTTEVSTWWPSLAKVLDTWYPGYADANGLLEDPFPAGDYAYVQRGGPLVAYYNALYARALEAGADVAGALGHTDAASRWRARAASLAAPFAAAFWDATAGAFSDTPGAATHPTDGNAFAVLAGLATPAQTTSALARLAATTRLPWGNGVADSDAWSTAAWGSEPSQRVYPFISYFDVLARFEAGDAAGALDELRRTWGWMLTHTPTGTDWEAIGAG